MMKQLIKTLVYSCFMLGWVTPAYAEVQAKRSLKIQGVTEHFDVRYLPAERYTGNEGPRGDIEMTLDVYVPSGDGPAPTVIYVHGGGYGGGSKNLGGSNKQFVTRLLEEGFVVVSLNYILHQKGIFPQCWWDFRDAVRFLRIHAKKYRIDPLRIGAYGLSAGGWMVSSATAGNGDLLRKNNGSAITIMELQKQGGKIRVKESDHHDNWLRPMRDPSPAWSGVHGGVAAVSMDFDHYMQHVQPYNPFYQKWAGVGYVPKFQEGIVANGAKANLEMAWMTSERHKGRSVHVPPFYPGTNKREADKAMALAADGSEVPLGDVVLDFFRRRLVKNCRLPAPEIYPVPRIFAEKTEVSMIAPPDSTVHYTTDGSQPDAKSEVYKAPFTIADDTVVKAVAVNQGFVTSGVNVAHFIKGQMPPKIIGPTVLPSTKTGEPYRVQFQSDSQDARWLIQGELVPHIPWRAKNMTYPNNMSFDSRTGIWSGTPYRPGNYWIQIWVNNGDGTLATHRDYRWEVTGQELAGQSWDAKATESDTNIELARLISKDGWHKGLLSELHKKLRFRGVKYHLVGEGEEDRLLIVERDDATTARKALMELASRIKKLAEKTVFLERKE